ncbi:MAG TPA: patatin-like phospholipase family protein, partial [Candidatus Limnocylindria bacterium]|nr:patatin-like phospholipase family protein [Candidatus Limnocylindria bacterium]
MQTTRPKIGLALSGSGNKSSFYIGFLEVFQENNITIDYIIACSGGCLVASAYACGTLQKFKEKIFSLDKESLRSYFVRTNEKGGIFSLQPMEDEMRQNFTLGMNFEDVKPLM